VKEILESNWEGEFLRGWRQIEINGVDGVRKMGLEGELVIILTRVTEHKGYTGFFDYSERESRIEVEGLDGLLQVYMNTEGKVRDCFDNLREGDEIYIVAKVDLVGSRNGRGEEEWVRYIPEAVFGAKRRRWCGVVVKGRKSDCLWSGGYDLDGDWPIVDKRKEHEGLAWTMLGLVEKFEHAVRRV